MIKLDHFTFDSEDKFVHEVLPPDHPLVRGQPINTPIYEQDFQWRLKVQPFSHDLPPIAIPFLSSEIRLQG
jgi:hypothetical protein